MKRSRLPLVVLLLAGVALSSCGGNKPTFQNLVLITVDTLRPDRLGYRGHDRETSPALDRLAASGIQFDRFYSQSGWTLPSVASILTGHYPRDHGAVEFNRALDPSLPTLASILQEQGYHTRAYVSHVVLRPRYGLDRGFDHYDHSVLEVGHPHKVATAEPLTDLVLADLEPLESPFFLWIHYFDPHFDYLAHPDWPFGDGRLDRYDAEIAHTDHHLGRLLEALQQRGLSRETLVVFTADHGEEFGEHGGRYHHTLYEEVVRTPLILHGRGLEARRLQVPGSQIDLLPTILPLMGVQTPEGLPGADLFGDLSSERPIILERDRPHGLLQRALLLGDHKLIAIEPRKARSRESRRRTRGKLEPGVELFDLGSDPGEQRNRYSPEDPGARELQRLLEAHLNGDRTESPEVELDEETRSKLRALGYLD